jgi:hypothetical protein
MITYVVGDIVNALQKKEIDILAHCCNTRNVFGSGLALQVAQVFPSAYDLDTRLHKRKLNKLGVAWLDEKSGVMNCYAQKDYGRGKRQVNYGALADCLDQIRTELNYHLDNVPSKSLKIGFPYQFASNRAGGDWNIVLEMIEYYLNDFDVLIYKLEGM